MFAFNSPCEIVWEPESNTPIQNFKYILDECKEKQVLKINLKYYPSLFLNEDIYALFNDAQSSGVGIECNINASKLSKEEMEKIDFISDFVSILINSENEADIVSDFFKIFSHVKIKIYVDKTNICSLEKIIKKFEPFSEKILAVFCTPKYNNEDKSNMLLQDETDDLSIDLIDIAEKFQDSFNVCYEDPSDEIRCLLSDKTVTNSIYIDKDCKTYINEWFKIYFGNVIEDGLDKIWDKSKNFWFLDIVKLYFSNFTSIYQDDCLECCKHTVKFEDIT